MKSLRVRSVSFFFGFLPLLSVTQRANAGSYVYGISDDNKIHQVDLISYIDTVVFDTGRAGLTNGVAWDSTAGKLYYRSSVNGSLYFWNKTTNSQGVMGGEALPGNNANASFYNGDYWYVEDGTDTLVRASFYIAPPTYALVANTYIFPDFDGTALSSFSFGDITIDKNGVLYGSSNYGLFSVNISGATPTQFQLLSSNFGVRQLVLDPTGTFLYGHDHATGNWYRSTFTGIETPVYSSSNVQFSSTPLRDVGAAIVTPSNPPPTETTLPEPAAWQLSLAGAACLAFARFRRKTA